MQLYIIINLLCFIVLFPKLVHAEKPTETMLYEKNSLYQYIMVIDDNEKRQRYIFNSKRDYMQGGIFIDNPDQLLFEYTQNSFISLAFLDRAPKDVLFVGLGSGSMPRYFHRYYPAAEVDVVELDPDILHVAEEYFFFEKTPGMNIHIQDGRRFIKRVKKQYDMIFLDAYKDDFIPFHLTTSEFLQEVKKKLKKGGVVVSNIASPFRNKFFYSMIETYKTVFPHLYIIKGSKAINYTNNYVFIATDNSTQENAENILREARELQKTKQFDIDLPMISWLFASYTDYEGNGEILTDDFAPVNIYRHMKTE
jgi:spermidine synthase